MTYTILCVARVQHALYQQKAMRMIQLVLYEGSACQEYLDETECWSVATVGVHRTPHEG